MIEREKRVVHKYLLKKVRERILTGLILLFIVGPVAFIYVMSQSIEIPALPAIVQMLRELLVRLILEGRARTGAAISGIGILIIIFGFTYLLATVILEYMKKR
jgi:hypothetical protein